MKKVEIYSNWCHYDVIDGVQIKTGDKLLIRWANGTETVHIAKVDSTVVYYSGHGGGDDIPISKAFVTIEYNGSTFPIRLVDAGVEAEVIEPATVLPNSGSITRKPAMK